MQDLIHFPVSVRENLANLLWSANGLGLSSYRWNLGGGGESWHASLLPMFHPFLTIFQGLGVSNPVRAISTFYVSQGVYNWTA